MPPLFISYCHDSEPHRAAVLTLAHCPLATGHEVNLDPFTPRPDPDWPRWRAGDVAAKQRAVRALWIGERS